MKNIIKVIEEEKNNTQNIILLGDFNINISSPNYTKLSHKLSKYNMKQHVLDYSTIYRTTIDYIFSNTKHQKHSKLTQSLVRPQYDTL